MNTRKKFLPLVATGLLVGAHLASPGALAHESMPGVPEKSDLANTGKQGQGTSSSAKSSSKGDQASASELAAGDREVRNEFDVEAS